ncbi:helix-turn-helix domain-containing protein [Epilithonimonas sp. JDS]|uniref:helix-turn-helix domain-containing protein n=1 Tax=Epilithonimonas sp. JDS TaxID=2902797 RepID=UPI001E4636D1|nr:helix-turn-helix domain-containing protein [Epilithonimonas sp. JDS]MCD9856274.1 helix-turn-helix domain-containing protein [Epilithonimonas sp. JDS]
MTFCLMIFCSAQNQNQEDLSGAETLDKSKISPESILNQSIEKLEQPISEEEKYEVRMKMADAYLKIKKPDFAKSTEMLFKAKEIAEKLDNTKLKAKIYGSIANQYSFLNFPDKIKPYLDLSKQQVDKLSNGYEKNFLTARLYIEYGNLEADKENFLVAKKDYQKALKFLGNIGNPNKKNIFQFRRAFYNMGVSYAYLKQNDSAEYFLNKALAIRDTENKEFKYFIYNTLAKVYIDKYENQRAIDSLETVLKEDAFKDNRLKSDMYKKLIASYKALNNKEKYIEYSEKLLELEPDVKDNNLKAINTAVSEEQKNLLEKISDKESYNQLLIFGCLLLIFVGGVSVFYINQKRKKEKLIYQNFISNLETKDTVEIAEQEPEVLVQEEKEKIAFSVPSSAETMILEKLEKFEASNKFTNSKLSVASLAVMFKTNPSYLSETIKKHKEKNFNNYINELRINYICKQILERPEFLNYKISYLAEEAGFSSHSSFTTVFKSITGISPSAFLREAEKKHKNI